MARLGTDRRRMARRRGVDESSDRFELCGGLALEVDLATRQLGAGWRLGDLAKLGTDKSSQSLTKTNPKPLENDVRISSEIT